MKDRLPATPVLAAHEAGMHDRKPQPDKCPACAKERNGR